MKTILLLLVAVFGITSLKNVGAQSFAPTDGILYVKENGSGEQSGASWDDAIAELADALKWAHENKTSWTDANPIKIYVAKGTYKPKYSPEDGDNSGTDQGRENTFYIASHMHVYGGFDPDNNITDLDHPRIFGPGGSILSGDFKDDDEITGSGATLEITGNDENAYHVVLISNPINMEDSEMGRNTVLDGFTITGGHANGAASPIFYVNEQAFSRLSGGGIVTDWFRSLTLANLIITGNTAQNNGGGMHNGNLTNSEATQSVFTNLTISENSANFGGGVYNIVAFPTFNNTVISGNKATFDGGGIRNYWRPSIEYKPLDNPTFNDVTITGNYAGRDGGGMYNSLQMSPALNRVTISNNTAVRDGGGIGNRNRASPRLNNVTITGNQSRDGGGIYNDDQSSPILNGTNITLNAGRDGGGIFNTSGSSPILDNVTVSENTATRDGGGIFSQGGASASSPVLTNVTIRENEAERNAGGLFFSGQSQAKLTEVTITGNTAASSGGGTYIQSSSEIEFRHVTISENTAAAGGGMFNASNAAPLLRNVDIAGNSAGSTPTTGSGGGMYNDNGAGPMLQNVTIRSNSAGFGGGIMNRGTFTRGTFINVLITGNLAGNNGGGIYNWTGSRPTLINVTLAGNKSTLVGGAIYNNENSGLVIQNSILWGNSGGIVNATLPANITITHSLVQGYTQTDNGNLSPDGIPADGNTIFNNPVSFESAPSTAGDYTLKIAGPVINAGNPETDFTFFPKNENDEPVDFAGNERIYGPRIDMGAYELIHESALPVSLAAFKATLQENTTLLTWQTTEEVNVSHFEIQRSNHGKIFNAVGMVPAKGESMALQTYNFIDGPVISSYPQTYYRLKTLDRDGSFTYSPIVSVSLVSVVEKGIVTLYPNPAIDRVFLKSIDWNNVKKLRLFNQAGNEVSFIADKSNNALDISNLPAGIYLLRIETENSPPQTYRVIAGR